MIFLIALMTYCAVVAARKGFNPVLWFLAGGGLLGLIAVHKLPNLNKSGMDAGQMAQNKVIGDRIAMAIVAAIGLFLLVTKNV